VSVSRLTLAAVFLVAVLVDSDSQSVKGRAAILVMSAYFMASILVFAGTWNSWWRDYRSAPLAHILDIVVFGTMVLLTDGYTSPFFTFSVFLILSATIRWSWRETLLTAAAVCVLFFAGGLTSALNQATPLEVDRVLIRATYLVVLSILVIWFGVTQEASRSSRPKSLAEEPTGCSAAPTQLALTIAVERMPAKRATIVWWDHEEPWVHVTQQPGGELAEARYGPQEFGGGLSDSPDDRPILFDIPNSRAITIDSKGRPINVPVPHLLLSPLLTSWNLAAGILVRIRSGTHSGEIILEEISGVCRDDLLEAARLGEELSNLFDRHSALSNSAEASIEKAKISLSRDLHDNVLQSLSGASFRLEALRSWIRAGRPADAEISAIQAQLADEQKSVRLLIHQLRNGRNPEKLIELGKSLEDLVTQLGTQWGIDCCTNRPSSAIQVPAWMERPIGQMIREAAANAVRHAGATRIECDIQQDEEEVVLSVRDNGRGFALDGKFDEQAVREKGFMPWSIYERAKGLGGSISLFSRATGSQLQVRLPIGGLA
jgi:signal transduction histidine kinase